MVAHGLYHLEKCFVIIFHVDKNSKNTQKIKRDYYHSQSIKLLERSYNVHDHMYRVNLRQIENENIVPRPLLELYK